MEVEAVRKTIDKALEFECADVGRLYIAVDCMIEWQKETGKPLEEFLEYLENTFPKKTRFEI